MHSFFFISFLFYTKTTNVEDLEPENSTQEEPKKSTQEEPEKSTQEESEDTGEEHPATKRRQKRPREKRFTMQEMEDNKRSACLEIVKRIKHLIPPDKIHDMQTIIDTYI